jgi:MFS family permease
MSRPEQAPVPHARPSLTYSGLLARPGALRAFGSAAVARLSFGMAGLSLLLPIHLATGSFAAAGAATGAYSAGTLTAPVKARLMDRRGQRAVLAVLGLGAAAALLAIVLLALARDRKWPGGPAGRARVPRPARYRPGDLAGPGRDRRHRHRPRRR